MFNMPIKDRVEQYKIEIDNFTQSFDDEVIVAFYKMPFGK